MGKPFEQELMQLADTYDLSLNISLDKLTPLVGSSQNSSLIAIGSGGSLTAAHYAALLHQKSGPLAKAVTPLEMSSLGIHFPDTSILIMSAGGKNADILSAFQLSAQLEPKQLLSICASKNSPLADLAYKYDFSYLLDFELPSGKDGFLATNSLLSFMVILARLYKQPLPEKESLLQGILYPEKRWLQQGGNASALLARDTWLVLYSGWSYPVAIDLESKFSEAALGHIQIVDYRNFGHGRHHWLAKRGAETGILALITPDTADIAERTLALVPENIPTLTLSTDVTGAGGSIDLFCQILHLVNSVGRARHIDPGRPGVPAFGRKLYHLRPSNSYKPRISRQNQAKSVSIARKRGQSANVSIESVELTYWHEAYTTFVQQLDSTVFGAISFDYDGTLCHVEERFSALSELIAKHLIYLLEQGVILGIATGRGKSVRTALEKAIPQPFWQQVQIGYYNGADIAPLGASYAPNLTRFTDSSILQIQSLLEANNLLSKIAIVECRPQQISIEVIAPELRIKAWDLLTDIVYKSGVQNVQMLESSHSIDILAPNVSKVSLAQECERVAKLKGNPANVLCIGDQGRWPGNDYHLLSTKYSLSVNSVSSDPMSCWNLCLPGVRGIQATLAYMKCMTASEGKLFFNTSKLVEK